MRMYFSGPWIVQLAKTWTVVVAALVSMLNPPTAAGQTIYPVVTATPEGGYVTGKTPGSSPAPSRYYIRGGIVLDRSADAKFKDTDCLSVSPAALYGCGKGIDGTPRGSRGDFGTMTGYEIGVGYVATPVLRFEALLQYRPGFSFQGNANFVQTSAGQDVSAELSSVSGMLTAYLDLPGFGPFTPLLGSGAGLNVVDIDEMHMAFPNTTTIVPGGRQVDLAVMMTAGFATALRSDIEVDLVWRYTDSGLVKTGSETGRVVWRDGRRDPLEIELAETRARLTSHGLQLSVRYAF